MDSESNYKIQAYAFFMRTPVFIDILIFSTSY